MSRTASSKPEWSGSALEGVRGNRPCEEGHVSGAFIVHTERVSGREQGWQEERSSEDHSVQANASHADFDFRPYGSQKCFEIGSPWVWKNNGSSAPEKERCQNEE